MPETSLHTLIQRLYPYKVMLGKEGQTAVTDALYVSCLLFVVLSLHFLNYF